MYRAFLYGNPGIIVTTAEACGKVLMDDVTVNKGLHGVSDPEPKRLHQLLQSPIAGQEA